MISRGKNTKKKTHCENESRLLQEHRHLRTVVSGDHILLRLRRITGTFTKVIPIDASDHGAANILPLPACPVDA